MQRTSHPAAAASPGAPRASGQGPRERPSIDPPPAPPAPAGQRRLRLASVDVLRGFVMFAMLFVNDVAGVDRAPAWMKHFQPPGGNGMTFVDVVFPAFLFIVGMSIPLAFASRLADGGSGLRLLPHILARTLALLVLGVLMVNGDADPARTGWPRGLWAMCVYLLGILAFLNLGPRSDPRSDPRSGRASLASGAVRLAGTVGLLVVAAVYRDGSGQWLKTSWWGILGLIGWAYLVASCAYLLLRGHREFLVAAIALLMALFHADKAGAFDGLWLRQHIAIGSVLGSHGALTLCGVLLGSMLLDRRTFTAQARWAAGFALLLLLAGWATYPVFGINKNAATPAWCFFCAAITCGLWMLFAFWLDARIDRAQSIALRFFIAGGQNALLAYMIAPIFYYAMILGGFTFYERIGDASAASGIARSLLFAAVVLGIAAYATARGMRLRL